MARNDWDDVIRMYKQMLNARPIWTEHAQVMLQLIPQLQKLPELQAMNFYTSLGKLVFYLPENHQDELHFYWWQDKFHIYLHNRENGEEMSFAEVQSEDILATIQEYIHKHFGLPKNESPD